MVFPPNFTIRPAGLLAVPFGVIELCQAGTSFTEPSQT